MIGCSDALGRIAFLMLNLYQRQAARAETDPLTCPFPLRRQHLADALGLTRAISTAPSTACVRTGSRGSKISCCRSAILRG